MWKMAEKNDRTPKIQVGKACGIVPRKPEVLPLHRLTTGFMCLNRFIIDSSLAQCDLCGALWNFIAALQLHFVS